MHYNHRYFAEFVPAPAGLDAVFRHIQQEVGDIRRSQQRKERRFQLLVGGAQPVGTMPTGSRFPDASRIDREASAIELYLGQLVAPAAMHDARETILDALGGIELSETAKDLAQLHQLCPAGATALLELRIGCGFRLLEAAKDEASRPLRGELGQFDHLISEMARIRVANMLRIIATDCAEQLHRPYGWAAVDDLDHASTGGTLRIGTLIKRLRDEIKLATRAFDLYRGEPSSRSGSAALHASSPRTAASLLRVSATTMAPFDKFGLKERALVQLALWRHEHGDDLEPLLATTIKTMREQLATLKRCVDDKAVARSHNAVAGNIDRTSADVRLLFAVEEAIAWTTEPVSNADEVNSSGDGLERLTARMSASDSVSALTRATSWLHTRSPTVATLPLPGAHQLNAYQVSELFLALRFVFLQDNEVLPTVLRTVTDPITRQPRRVKTHGMAARLRGSSYSFSDYWDAIKADESARVANRASGMSVSEALGIDLAARRNAKALRQLPPDQLPLDAMLAMRALGDGVRYSFVTP